MKLSLRLLVTVLLGLAGLVAVGVPVDPHPAAAAGSADPSGQAMPVGDLPGWHQVFADNFANYSYPLGSFTGCRQKGCSGTPNIPWGAVLDGLPDSSGNCQYYPSKTLSITDGVMHIFLHTDPNDVCMGASVYPVTAPLKYGMYSVRFRADPVLGYKGVFFLWPVDRWSGEINFPEGNLENDIHGFVHRIAGGTEVQRILSNASWADWHTATMQWTPYSVTFILDGTPLGTTSVYVPQTPMTLALRGESNMLGAPKPAAGSQGNIQIDWATIYTYAGDPGAISASPTTLGQGADAATLTLTGPGFTFDAQVGFSTPGIIATGPPVLVTAHQLDVPVRVAQGAALGSSDVTVTQLSQSWTCAGCLTVAPGPTVTSIGPGAVVGHTQALTLSGTNLQSGLTLTTPAAGVRFGAPTSVTPTDLTTLATVSSTTPAGAYDVTVTNPDQGSVTCVACLDVLTPPSPPIMGIATAGDGQVTVAFNPPLTDGGSTVTSYTATAHDVTTPANGGQTATGTASPLTVTGVVNGDRYRMTVTATSDVGTSRDSTWSDSVVPATVAGAPTIGIVMPGNAKATVNFAPPSSNGGTWITGYTVTALDTTTPANGGQVQSGTKSPVVVTGLTNGDTYQFTVYATNSMGSGPASGLSGPVVPAKVPTAAVIGPAKASSTHAVVTFSPPASDGGSAITGYRVRATDDSQPANGGQVRIVTTSPADMSGLTNGDHYRFNVAAVNAVGTGPNSAMSNSVVPSTVPDAPNMVTATAGNARATVTFGPPPSDGGAHVTGYTVTSIDETTPANGGQVKAATASPVTVTGLTNGDTYLFTVTATNVSGTGPPSGRSNKVVPATVPGAPGNVKATSGSSAAIVSFTPPTSNGGAGIAGYTVIAVDTSIPENGGQTATGLKSPIAVPGLVNGDTYRFTVSASNRVGTGPKSAQSNSVHPSTVPGAPTIESVAAGSARAVVTFRRPASDGGTAIIQYVVIAIDGTDPLRGGQVTSADSSPTTVTGLTAGDTYRFTVTAVNADGAGPPSAPSDPVVPA